MSNKETCYNCTREFDFDEEGEDGPNGLICANCIEDLMPECVFCDVKFHRPTEAHKFFFHLKEDVGDTLSGVYAVKHFPLYLETFTGFDKFVNENISRVSHAIENRESGLVCEKCFNLF